MPSGRFTLEGMPPSGPMSDSPSGIRISPSMRSPSTPRATARLRTALRSVGIVPVRPEFTHALEPARPVQGRVTDKETGKPLAGMLVEVIPMRSHGGMPFHARTDADGRYRVSGHQAERDYNASFIRRPIPATWPQATHEQKWPAGAKFIQKNFALEKGRIVQRTGHGCRHQAADRQCRGRLPTETGQPQYHPEEMNSATRS